MIVTHPLFPSAVIKTRPLTYPVTTPPPRHHLPAPSPPPSTRPAPPPLPRAVCWPRPRPSSPPSCTTPSRPSPSTITSSTCPWDSSTRPPPIPLISIRSALRMRHTAFYGRRHRILFFITTCRRWAVDPGAACPPCPLRPPPPPPRPGRVRTMLCRCAALAVRILCGSPADRAARS
jgi:hypothetical protein